MEANKEDKKHLKRALELAKESFEKGGFPAGAVIVKDGKVIAEGIAIGNILHDPTSHDGTSAIREACKKLSTTNLDGATLYTSLQPCLMCFSVANWAGISRIVIACRKTDDMVTKQYYEGTISTQEVNQVNTRKIDLQYILDFEEDSLDLIKNWENQ